MKFRAMFFRTTAMLLCLFLVGSAFVQLPVSAAADLNETEAPCFRWDIDFNKMASVEDNGGSDEYTLKASNDKFKLLPSPTDPSRAVMGIENYRGNFRVNDVGDTLDDCASFVVEADMYFASFPHGAKTTADDTTANQYPLSLITWVTSTPAVYRSFRVDEEGYLCTAPNDASRTNLQLPLAEWFTLRFLIDPTEGYYEVILITDEGEESFIYNFSTGVDVNNSFIRFFDGYYFFDAYVSRISVYSLTDSISIFREASADYYGYQVKPVTDGTFDIRFLSTLAPDSFTADGVSASYTGAGYELITLWSKNGKPRSESVTVSLSEAYRTILADGQPYAAPDGDYLVATALYGVDATRGRLEFVVRPYIVLPGGSVLYGTATVLCWDGETDGNGCPVLTESDQSSPYTLMPSDDTFVGFRKGVGTNKTDESSPNGDENVMYIKDMPGTDYYRASYVKFSLTDVGMTRAENAARIYLRLYCGASPTETEMTEEELAAGGAFVNLYGTTADWDEDTLDSTNYQDVTVLETVSEEEIFAKGEWLIVDVTDYVKFHAADGAVSFMLDKGTAKSMTTTPSFRTKEYLYYEPQLVVYPTMYNHEVMLNKSNNEGYEPWSYARAIVDKWMNESYDNAYGEGPLDYSLTDVDRSSPNGAYTIASPFRFNRMSNGVQTQIYLRSVESLAQKAGYSASATIQPTYSKYGGITNAGITGEATGFFHTEQIGGREFIIDPLGYPYFAVGMNTVELGATDAQKEAALNKYGSAEKFYQQVTDELLSLGINTVYGGDWEELLATDRITSVVNVSSISGYMSSLKLGDPTGAQKFLYNNTMNVFDPDFVTFSNNRYKETIGAYANNPRILGYTSDNEIPYESDMLYRYLTIDPFDTRNAFSYATAWTFLMARTGKSNPSVDDITDELLEEFKCFVYDRYYQVITGALEYAGAKQMYLGNRINGENRTCKGYLRAASQYVDILTVNLYGGPQPPADTIEIMYRYAKKPILVTEFYAKAIDGVDLNGIPLMNQINAGWIVEDQEMRGAHYENYALRLLEARCCVGWTWYRFRDNDQRVYADAAGNLYVDYEISNGAILSFIKVGKLNADGSYAIDEDLLGMIASVDLMKTGDPYRQFVTDIAESQLTVIHKGEHGGDQSNNGSNKGLYDNRMNIYDPLADAYLRVKDHIMGLVRYFDEK